MKKRWLLLIVVGIVLIGGIMGRILLKPDPNELVQHGLERLNGATSFRYAVTQNQWINGQERVLTQIQGEKDGGNIHLLGQLVGSEVEMTLIGEAWYNRDPFTKKWVKFSNPTEAQDVFLAEVSPLSSLQFKETGEVVLSGQTKVDGKKAWVCSLHPSVQNQIMEEFWTDFAYTFYIGKSSKDIVKVDISAKSKDKSQTMNMELEFKDIGKKITIMTPDL